MKKNAIALVGAMLMLRGLEASAVPGEVANAQVGEIHISRVYGNFVFIHLSNTPTIRAACSTNSYWHFTLSLADAAGKNMYAQLVAAVAGGIPVSIKGTEACSEFATSESVAGLGITNG